MSVLFPVGSCSKMMLLPETGHLDYVGERKVFNVK